MHIYCCVYAQLIYFKICKEKGTFLYMFLKCVKKTTLFFICFVGYSAKERSTMNLKKKKIILIIVIVLTAGLFAAAVFVPPLVGGAIAGSCLATKLGYDIINADRRHHKHDAEKKHKEDKHKVEGAQPTYVLYQQNVGVFCNEHNPEVHHEGLDVVEAIKASQESPKPKAENVVVLGNDE